MRSALSWALTATTVLLAFARPAGATHWRVDPGGAGDFTTIQAALEAGGRDSVLVEPGVYPETLVYTPSTPSVVLIGTDGAAVTRIETLVTEDITHGVPVPHRIRGLTFGADLDLAPADIFDFRTCVFLGSVRANGRDRPANFADCDFHARTTFQQYSSAGEFTDLRFHSAPLQPMPSGTGPNRYTRCVFEGPADTLVIAYSAGGENPVQFSECRFSSAGYGIVYVPNCDSDQSVYRCVFTDIAGAAITYEDTVTPPCSPLGVSVANSRFERCGRAVVWRSPMPPFVGLSQDTILCSRSDAIVVTPDHAVLSGLVMRGGGAGGVVIDPVSLYPYVTSFSLLNSEISGFAGDGLRVNAVPSVEHYMKSSIRGCTVRDNGGDGLDVNISGVALSGNVVTGNGGHGISLTSTPFNPYHADSILSNTCVDNGGDGIRVVRGAGGADQPQIVQRNLTALNQQAGVQAQGASSVAFNDAWENVLSPYGDLFAPLDSNLVADPLFCNLNAGNFTLQMGSPCAPDGPYGLIGALPVSCPNVGVIESWTGRRLLQLSPNPSSGTVSFAAGPHEGGLLEVFDLQGRLLWARRLGAGEETHWDGVVNGAELPDGVYLARFSAGSQTGVVRLVRLH